MEKTWRWFGPDDKITLNMLRQIGVEGIVTSLHHIASGEIWTQEDILKIKDQIEDAGMCWSVVESLPVSESIKYAGKNRDELINRYKISLTNLGKSGIRTVCYNFMPVIDWIRTDLNKKLSDGSFTLYFDKIRFGYFDCFILNREGALTDYSSEEQEKINTLNQTITPEEIEELIDTIIIKTQGFIHGNFDGKDPDPVKAFRQLLSLYKDIDKEQLRENLRYFLEAIMPVCREYDIRMCIHPDDPPYQMLGLPRIVTSQEDIEWLLKAVDDPCNGLTFCAGSLSAGLHNDLLPMAKSFLNRIEFVHLRSTDATPEGNFIEAPHLAGRGDLISLVELFEKHIPDVPMRIDHGKLMFDDARKGYNPGYSLIGRMIAFAQIEGVMAAVNRELT